MGFLADDLNDLSSKGGCLPPKKTNSRKGDLKLIGLGWRAGKHVRVALIATKEYH